MTTENYDLKCTFYTDALARNIAHAREVCGAELAAVVKADAYGFGLNRALPVMKAAGIKSYFVQDVIDGIDARALLGAEADIYVMSGAISGQYDALVKHDLIPAIVSVPQLSAWREFSAGRGLRTALHFDTGMNRTGILSEEFVDFGAETRGLDVRLYMSHLYDSGRRNQNSLRQKERFDALLARLPRLPASLAATGGILVQGREYDYDMARVGHALYGLVRGFEPVVKVEARILQTRDVAKGDAVGYSGTYRAPKDMRVAVLCVGYKDGYPRDLSHTNTWRDWLRSRMHSGTGFTRSWVVIGGYRCPLVGIVSMNNITVDVSSVPADVLAGVEWAEILGEGADWRHFFSASGFRPVDMVLGLLRPNKNSLHLTV